MANVVLLYTGNVCSTPMVEFARTSDRILVPVREQFDPYQFEKLSPDADRWCATLARVLAALFSRDGKAYAEWPNLATLLPHRQMPDINTVPHTFFKWRSETTDRRGADDIAAVFLAHQVEPVVILRRSVVEHALKIQLSEMLYGKGHPQFHASRLDAESYARYIADQALVRMTLDEAAIDVIVERARRIALRTRRLISQRDFYFGSNRRRAVIAETIFRPAIDIDRYETCLDLLFGDRVRIDPSSQTTIRKGGLEVTHCANAEDVMRDSRLVEVNGEYQQLVAKLDVINLEEPAPERAVVLLGRKA